jgi:flagellin
MQNMITNFETGTALSMTNVLSDIDIYTDAVSRERAIMGAVQNRLEYTISALGIYQENLMAAESRIRDVDMAQEMTNFTKLQILQQSGTAMLAQANMSSQSILSLLQ